MMGRVLVLSLALTFVQAAVAEVPRRCPALARGGCTRFATRPPEAPSRFWLGMLALGVGLMMQGVRLTIAPHDDAIVARS